MPLLASLLVSLFGSLAGFLGQYVSKKVAVGVSAVAVLGTLTAALLVTMNTVLGTLFSGFLSSLPVGGWIGLAFPPAATTCLTAMGTTWAGCTLYSWQRKSMDVFLKA